MQILLLVWLPIKIEWILLEFVKQFFVFFCYVCFDLLLIRQIKAVREFSIISASKKLLVF